MMSIYHEHRTAYLSIYPPVCPSIHLPVHPSVYGSYIYIYMCIYNIRFLQTCDLLRASMPWVSRKTNLCCKLYICVVAVLLYIPD